MSNKNKWRDISKVAWNLITVLSILVLVSMVGSKLLTGWSSVFSYRTFYIMSESMEPEIAVHQMVVGEHVPVDEELEVGGIYAYRREGIVGTEIIIHRLISITEDGKYQFKGDNNQLPDAELVERDAIGYRIVLY